ncbi:DEAD/DEAH box helicase [Limnothrix sp. FACHB-1083]|uniref:DEAD/DEAH box helicase n=1 Tax=unclassified Limnothrix TaxID=2632864 RepID=UPI0016806985|nr:MULTISPECIES: DEAD/DEAH box helicase [unclassified Limnothrix]MBD2161280.1 DEAD/DEAH box helicase [Limnothrix sp. FACHB-1083]MBD2192208.1 DEAD/DEAH box helicase [Limnothrix sp. FACHB-1088]
MNTLDLLDKRIASAFYGNFPTLRPAQEAAIEPLILGKNLVLSSGTGSGKTEAVMAPLISRYWRQAIGSDALTILYIAPTKALVNDLETRLSLVLQKIRFRVGIRHGDRDDLKSALKPHILITTPESLDVLLFRKDSALANIQAVVIDEVHLLYNTQRGLQLSVLIQRLKQKIEHPLQQKC